MFDKYHTSDMHQHRQYMQARFPFLEDLFFYKDDKFIGINGEFSWEGFETITLMDLVISVSSTSSHVRRYSDHTEFMTTLKELRVFSPRNFTFYSNKY